MEKHMTVTVSDSELARQRDVMSAIKLNNLSLAVQPRARVMTFGCQQNEADSERLRGMLLEMGYALTENDRDADVIVLNTCAVREHAEARVFGVIGALSHLKREFPERVIAVCGCMAQRQDISERIRNSYKHVELVFGTHVLHRFPELLAEVFSGREQISDSNRPDTIQDNRVFENPDSPGVIAEGLPVARDGTVKAWLSVMYGCNNFCSYCVVPYVRGRERSRSPDAVLSDARELVAAGYRDITLLGQNVNSYGKNSDERVAFPELLRKVSDIPGDFRVRFMTSHPKDAGAELFRAMRESEKIARCLHLPFQSGSTRVLELMNRGYTREHYLELIAMAREAVPGLVVTSDVIVGFPGETERDFLDTLELVEKVRFDALFTFIYSPRPGAPASLIENNTPPDEIQRRFDALLSRQNEISGEIHAGYIGKTERVLIDTATDDAKYPLEGRTSGNRLVRLRGEAEIGEFVDAKITDSNRFSLVGEKL
jgi:tRNA-2-methylthio-N6-dimethylallyladenosine synthase